MLRRSQGAQQRYGKDARNYQILHLEGGEVFGSQKRKPDKPLGDKQESHKLDRVNFTCPRVKTRSSQAQQAQQAQQGLLCSTRLTLSNKLLLISTQQRLFKATEAQQLLHILV
jgi:transcription initiation factor IIE alpha subunit